MTARRCGGLLWAMGCVTVMTWLGAALPAAETTETAPLIVHEWGTFTSFSGSDGVKLEFRPLEEHDLPPFVYNRFRHSFPSLSKYSISAIQRMETPVTYFYTPIERDVTVRVSFPQGLLTEFYPPVQAFGPKVKTEGAGLFLAEANWPEPGLKDSWLDWGRVHLIPPETLRPPVADAELSRRISRHVERTMVPETGQNRHYAEARETDSAIVQVRHTYDPGENNKKFVPQADYFEKFLFYRGLGNFDLPLRLSVQADGCSLHNFGSQEIRSLFLVTVRKGEIQFRSHSRIAADGVIQLPLPNQTRTIDDLSKAVVTALTAEGLYEKEAVAMFNTWQKSWFGEEGTRLFYILPQSVTDALLPLEIKPQPTEQVRVLVGRLEIMTPSQEQEILSLVARSHETRKEGRKSPLLAEFVKLGRLGEPALVRAKHLSTNEALQQEAQQLIVELREARKTRN